MTKITQQQEKYFIGHGFQFCNPAERRGQCLGHVVCFNFDEYVQGAKCPVDRYECHNAGFINGVFTAKMTKTKIGASIGGTKIPGVLGICTASLKAKSNMFGIREGRVCLTDFHEAVPEDVRDAVMDICGKFKTDGLDCVRPENVTD
jgi:hypothetical protein